MYVLSTYRRLNSLCEAASLLAAISDESTRAIISKASEAAQRNLVKRAAAAGILDKVRGFAARNNNPQVVSVIDHFTPSV